MSRRRVCNLIIRKKKKKKEKENENSRGEVKKSDSTSVSLLTRLFLSVCSLLVFRLTPCPNNPFHSIFHISVFNSKKKKSQPRDLVYFMFKSFLCNLDESRKLTCILPTVMKAYRRMDCLVPVLLNFYSEIHCIPSKYQAHQIILIMGNIATKIGISPSVCILQHGQYTCYINTTAFIYRLNWSVFLA